MGEISYNYIVTILVVGFWALGVWTMQGQIHRI